jgi:hypothetical protein
VAADPVMVRCRVVRWVGDDPQPGLVEVVLRDVHGEAWTFADKAPVFDTAGLLHAEANYPIPVLVACLVRDWKYDMHGRRKAVIDLSPWGINTEQTFEVAPGQLTGTVDRRYDRRALIHTYLNALGCDDDGVGGYRREYDDFNTALRAYYQNLLAGLEKLFKFSFTSTGGGMQQQALMMLVAGTARSYLAVRTPWAGPLEAGLLVKQLEQTGEPGSRVIAASTRIDELRAQMRAAHLEVLDALVEHLLGDRSERYFSSRDLRTVGVEDDQEPDVADYPPEW